MKSPVIGVTIKPCLFTNLGAPPASTVQPPWPNIVNIVSVPLFASVTPGADQPGHMLCLSLYLRRRHETAPNRTKQPSETSDLIQQGVFSPVQRP